MSGHQRFENFDAGMVSGPNGPADAEQHAGFEGGQLVDQAGQPVETTSTAGQPATAPGLLAGKFKTPQELEAAYHELQRKLGAPKAPPAAKPAATPAPAGTNPLAIAKAPKADGAGRITSAELARLSGEYETSGKIADESYAKFEKLGIDREVVDFAVAGALAIAAQRGSRLFELVGGKEKYEQMAQWAAQALDEDELNEYTAVVTSGNERAAQLALKGLHARWLASSEPQSELQGARPPSNGGPQPFKSFAEYKVALKDPRYKTDEAFRAYVDSRLEQTTAF